MKFKSGVSVILMGVNISVPIMAWVGEGGTRSTTSFKVKVDTESSALQYIIQVWGDKNNNEEGEAIVSMVTGKQRRVVVVGFPADTEYKGKIQHQVTVKELWIEDESGENFIAVVLPRKTNEEVVREYKPIELPVLVSETI